MTGLTLLGDALRLASGPHERPDVSSEPRSEASQPGPRIARRFRPGAGYAASVVVTVEVWSLKMAMRSSLPGVTPIAPANWAVRAWGAAPSCS